jgi:fibronectin-binding autotransporter adhesin
MELKRIRCLVLVFCLICSLAVPVSGFAADKAEDWTIYARPGIRFGSDDRTIFTSDFLVPLWQTDKDILFFNPRLSLDDRDGSEINLGFGYRRLLFSDKVILGVNGFYDSRHTGWDTRHEQVGIGAEVMTEWVTGRFNGYFPVTGPQLGTMGVVSGGYFFRDVGIYTGIGSLEETLGGFDGELGVKVPYLSKYMETWVYAGGYHFEGDYVRAVNGFSTRLEVIPTDFLKLGFEYRNDTLNGNQYFGEASVTVPFSIDNLVKGKNPFEGIGKHFGGERTLHERLVEPVRRDVDVRLYNAGSGPNLPGTEALIEDVVFVSEGAADGAGAGTFEDPFASIAEAVTAIGSGGIYTGVTTVHVMDDSGSDVAGGGTADIASLLIWGSGSAHPTYGYITNQYLTNPDITGLEITADGVEVFGANFVGTTGITTSGSGTYVHDNYFTATTGLNVTGGSATITRNAFTGTFGVRGTGGTSTITDNDFLGDALGIYTTGGNLTVTGNRFTGVTYGVDINGGISTVTGNTFTGGGYGIYSESGASTVTDNDFSDNSYGIYSIGGDLTVTDNRFTGGMYDAYLTGGTAAISDNTFTGIYGVYGTGGSLAVTDNDFMGNMYGIVATGGASTITGNTLGTSADPITIIGIYAGSGVTLNAVSGNTVVVSGTGTVYGIESFVANLVLGDNDISVTSGSGTAFGIYAYRNTGDLTGSITGGSITATGNNAYGAYLVSAGGSIGSSASPFTVSGATIDAAGTGDTYGLYLSTGGDLYASVIDSDITGTSVSGTGYGIYEYASSVINGSITGGSVTGSGNTAYGIYLRTYYGSIGSAASPFAISGVTVNATGTGGNAYGIWEYTQEGDLYGSITGGSITASGTRGVGIYLEAPGAIGDSSTPFTVSGNTITAISTTDYAVGFLASADGGDIYALLTDNIITATSSDYSAYGISEFASGNLGGRIYGGSVTASGLVAEGAYLCGGDTIGSSTDPYTISGVTFDVTATFPTYTYGVRYLTDGYLYTSIGISSITVNNAMGVAFGVYGYGYDGLYGAIGNSTITATGLEAHGVELRSNGSIGSASNPFTISGMTITATGSGGNACGLYEYANNGDIFGFITGGSITASGLSAYGVYLLADTGSIGSSGSPFTISGAVISGTATGNYDAYGVYMESAGGDIYAVIEQPYIIATTGNAFAYGVYENAADDIYGEISDGTIIARGENQLYGVRLSAGGSIGGSGNYFTISDVTIEATGTGAGSAKYAAGVYLGASGNIYSLIEDNYITAGESSGGVNAYGVYESARGTIYGEISGGSIAATGWVASGVRLDTYGSIGDSTNPFTISDATITATASDKQAMGVEIMGMSYGDMYTAIIDSYITATSNSSFAYGVYGSTSGNLHTTITDSYITATSENYTTYGLYEWAGGSISGGIWGGSITVNGDDGAAGVYLESLSSIGSSGDPFTVSAVTINATGAGDTYGLSFDAGDDLYSFIDGDAITATSVSGFAYGAYEHAYDNLRGEFYSGRITASGLGAYGIYLLSDTGSIGSSSDLFEISRTRVTSTATGYYDVYGVYMESAGGNIYAAIKNANITAANGDVYAYGVFETAQGTIYGEISGGTITATGVHAIGVRLDTYGSLGDSTNPFTISGATITAAGTTPASYVPATGVFISSDSGGDLYAAITGNTITATSENSTTNGIFEFTNGNLDTTITDNYITATSGSFAARGIYEWAGGSIDGGIWGGSITVSGDDSATAITLYSSGSIGSSTSPFTVSGVTAYVTSDLERYFMYLTGSGSGTSAITWTGNSYTPYGGLWSGNYDTSGFVTNGPLYLNGITDAEVTP